MLGHRNYVIQRRTPFLFDFNGIDGWEEAGGVVRPVTVDGIAGTFTRAGIKTAVDSNGRIYNVPNGFPALHHMYSSSAWTPQGVLLERAGTNVALYSEDLTNWTDINTPTITQGLKRCGVVALDKLGDNGNDGKKRSVTFTGDGVKTLSFLCAASADTGGLYSTSVARVVIEDTSAAAARVNLTLQFTGNTDPTSLSVTMATGTNLNAALTPKAIRLTDNIGQAVYLIQVQLTSVTAANTHELRASLLGEGAMYFGGWQVEDHSYPSSYIKTTSGSASRVADLLTFPWLIMPQNVTAYEKTLELGTFLVTGTRGFQVGDDDAGTSGTFYTSCNTAGDVRLTHHNGTSSVTADASTGAAAWLDTHEIRAVPLYAGAYVGRSLNGAAETVSSAASYLAHPSSYAEALLSLTPDATYLGAKCTSRFRIGLGERTLAQMQAGR